MTKRGRCRYKRGSVKLSGWTIVEILFIVMIAMFIFSFVNSVKDSHIFRMSYLTKDMALLTDAVQSVPGDISYSYSQQNFNFSEYRYLISNVDVKIFQKDDEYTYQSYPYFDDQTILNMYTKEFKQPKSIMYEKKGDILFISDGSSINPTITNCIDLTNKAKFKEGFLATYFLDDIGKGVLNSFSLISNSFQPTKYENKIFETHNVQNTSGPGIKSMMVVGGIDSPANEFPVMISCLDKTEECIVFACILKNRLAMKQEIGFTSIEIIQGVSSTGISGAALSNIVGSFNPSLLMLLGKDKAQNYQDKIGMSINEAITEYDKKAAQAR